MKSLQQIIQLIPGKNKEQFQTKDELLSNLKDAQDHFDETSDEMSQ